MADSLPLATARSTLAGFLARCFCEPEPDLLFRLNDSTARTELLAATRAIDVRASLFLDLLDSLLPLGLLSERYNTLFGHAVRGDCPLYEIEYARGEIFQQSHRLADVAGFYRAFGLCIDDTRCERVDHVAAEWEFLAVCAAKQARAEAWSAGLDAPPPALDSRAAAQSCIDAQRAFLRDHAAAWMPAFFNRVRRADADGFFGRCAIFADAVVRRWCAHLNVPYGPDWLELRPVDDQDLAIECGPEREPGRVSLGPGLTAALRDT